MPSRWPRRTVPALFALLPFLAGCYAPSTVSAPALAAIPQDLYVRCDDPVRIPDKGPMEGAPASRLWAIDRQNLRICGDRQNALARAAIALESQGKQMQAKKPGSGA